LVRRAWHHPGDAVVLVDDRGWIAGVVTAGAAGRVPLDRQAATPAARLLVPVEALAVGRPEEPLQDLLARMRAADGHPAVVLDGENRLAGVVTLEDVRRHTLRRWRQPSGV
ncbi:MAG TPA: CBS domain-containing protein, partial [Acidimicrobiales bacterium]|nr:CBS domain-containing protein [Acidimicrobiales bacterium]